MGPKTLRKFYTIFDCKDLNFGIFPTSVFKGLLVRANRAIDYESVNEQ